MAQFKKFNSHLCVFLICQFLLSIAITNSAVIRRETRSISSNVTVNNEVDPGSVPTNEDIENLLLEDSSVKDKTTTENTIQSTIIDNEDMKKETTVTTQTVDENTVGLSSDSQESPKAKETITTTESMPKNEKTTMHEEMPTTTAMETTVKTTDKKIPITTESQNESEEHSTVSDVITNDTTIQGPEAETPRVTTLEESDSLEHTTLVDPIENTANEKIASAEEDSTNISIESEEETVRPPKTEDPIHVVSTSTIDLVTNMSTMKDEIGETVTEQSTAEVSTTNNLKANPKEISTDGKLMPVTTITTESVLPISDGLTDDSKTSTVKLDETTVLSTSTETSDEETVKDDEVQNSTPSASSEKRGKFIAHNFSSFNELHLPNTSDVWALAGLKFAGKPKPAELQENSVETSEEKPVNNSMGTKNLLDWTRVMETTQGMDSETTLKSSHKDDDDTTTTELPTTNESVLLRENEVEIASSKLEADETTVTVDMINTSEPKLEKIVPESRTETTSSTVGSVANSGPKIIESPSETTTEASVTLTDTTEVKMAVGWTDATEVKTSVPLTDTTEAKVDQEPETTTNFDDKVEGSTFNHLTTDAIALKETETAVPNTDNPAKSFNRHEDELIEENKVDGANFEKEIQAESTTTTTTTTTPIPDIVSMKSETTNSHANDGETTEETNAGTTSLSTSSLLDFTTSIPFLTSTIMTTTTTEAPPTTPVIVFNMDDAVNESPNMTSTQIPLQSSSPSVVMDVTEPVAIATTTTATTTTTTMPADTFMAGTTESETQTTTEAPHTPAIITSNDTTTIIQKSNNYHEYEVVNKTTEKSDDSSSTESIEATTHRRVASSSSTWSTTSIGKISTKEVESIDFEFDTTTAPNFDENSNTFGTESTTTSAVISAGVTLAPNKSKPTHTTAPVTVRVQTSTEDLDHIDPIHKISDTAETSIESNVIDPLHVGETSTKPTTSATTTTENNMRMQSNESVGVDSNSSTSTTTTSNAIHDDDSSTTLQSISTKNEDIYSIVPTNDYGGFHVPKLILDDTTTLMPPRDLGISGIGGVGGSGGLQPMDSQDGQETDVNVIIAISVSTVGIIALILLVAFLYVMRKRQKQMSYGQRCRPVSLDAYSLDNVSVYNSVRRKGATLRASKRSYGNVAFDDPSLRHNALGTHELAKYVEKKSSIWEEFKEVPQIIARADEVPAGCEDKNRYANVIPLPETRVILQQQNGDEKSEYINANYVRGPKDTTNYYIACQAPLETTVNDFWRMIWEQNSRVIIMATDLMENGIEKCAEYLPPSVTLDNHTSFGEYQVTLKHREVKEKYAISTLTLKNTTTDESREITHYWYQWPEAGVPTDEAAIIAMLLEARSSLKLYAIEQDDNKIETIIAEDNVSQKVEINGNVNSEKQKPVPKDQGPLTIHCSPGTGRTGTILACDIAMRCLEEPKRIVDIPQIVYSVRRGRASAVQTKEQYEFIYQVTHMYATKISNINNDN